VSDEVPDPSGFMIRHPETDGFDRASVLFDGHMDAGPALCVHLGGSPAARVGASAPVFDQLERPAGAFSGRVLGAPLGRHFSEVVDQVPGTHLLSDGVHVGATARGPGGSRAGCQDCP
jgi:hypothetical protein